MTRERHRLSNRQEEVSPAQYRAGVLPSALSRGT